MPDTKRRVHDVVIQVHTNRAITAAQARYAAWNALQNYELFSNDTDREPWTVGHITVPLRAPTKEKIDG